MTKLEWKYDASRSSWFAKSDLSEFAEWSILVGSDRFFRLSPPSLQITNDPDLSLACDERFKGLTSAKAYCQKREDELMARKQALAEKPTGFYVVNTLHEDSYHRVKADSVEDDRPYKVLRFFRQGRCIAEFRDWVFWTIDEEEGEE